MSPAKVPAPRAGLFPVLRNTRFMVFTLSQAVSLFGDKLDYMALLAMVAFYSARLGWQSSRAISFLSVVAALPTILFAPVAGVLVDRWDRRKLMIGCDSARALLVLAIPLVAVATTNLPLVYALAFLVFLFGLVFNTARMSVIPNLVGGDPPTTTQLPFPLAADQEAVSLEQAKLRASSLLGANSLMSFAGRLATLLGMVVGGLIVDWAGWQRLGITRPWAAGFYIDSLTYLVSVIALVAIYRQLADVRRPAAPTTIPITRPVLNRFRRMLAELREAWRLVIRTPSVLFVYLSTLVLVVMGAAVFVLFIPLVQGSAATGLGLGTKGVGYVAAIGSVGLVLSSMGYGLLGHHAPRHKVILASFLVLALAMAGLALARSFALVAPIALVAGLALSPVYIAMDTLIHESVPTETRGRVFSSREWVMHLAFAASAALVGQLTRFASLRRLLLTTALLVLVVVIVGFIATRRREIG